jgi:hypothetical protein
MAAKKPVERPVLVTTSHRGVFFGYATDTSGDRIHLRACKMAIYWATKKGLFELAHTGPNANSRVSLPADIEVRGVTSVMEVTLEAVAKWESA